MPERENLHAANAALNSAAFALALDDPAKPFGSPTTVCEWAATLGCALATVEEACEVHWDTDQWPEWQLTVHRLASFARYTWGTDPATFRAESAAAVRYLLRTELLRLQAIHLTTLTEQ
jgi:hypothetical protein